jgi:hypothetical protein
MNYPSEFSVESCNRIEIERLNAIRDLRQSLTPDPPASWTRTIVEGDQRNFYSCLLRVYLEFVRQACKLARNTTQGTWGIARIRNESCSFLRLFAIEQYYERGKDRFGRMFDSLGGLLPEVQQAFEKFPEWQQAEQEMRGIVDAAKDDSSRSQPGRAPVKPQRWEDIMLSIVGDHDVNFRVDRKDWQVNYKDIPGFQDRRTGNPSQLWAMLRVFARFPDRTLPENARNSKEWIATRKKVERTSKILREYFGLTDDPFPYIAGVGYRARINFT